jgi:hypothetical protein
LKRLTIDLDRFDLLDRDLLGRIELEIHQPAQRVELAGLVVHQLGKLAEQPVVALATRPLQQVDRLRVEQVELAVRPPLIEPARIQRALVGLARARTRCRGA